MKNDCEEAHATDIPKEPFLKYDSWLSALWLFSAKNLVLNFPLVKMI